MSSPTLIYLLYVLTSSSYFPLFSAFSSTSGDMSALSSMINSVKSECSDSTVLGSFSENHDQPRFASVTQDYSLAKNIIAYTILADGIPIIYEGQEQHYNALGGSSVPYNREAIWYSDYNTEATLYQFIKTLNTIRTYAINAASGEFASSPTRFVCCLGENNIHDHPLTVQLS